MSHDRQKLKTIVAIKSGNKACEEWLYESHPANVIQSRTFKAQKEIRITIGLKSNCNHVIQNKGYIHCITMY